MRKFREFFSELFLIAAKPPKIRSSGAVSGTETKADTTARMTASALAAADNSFILPSQIIFLNACRNEGDLGLAPNFLPFGGRCNARSGRRYSPLIIGH